MFLASLLLAAPQGAVDRSPFRFRQPSPRKPNVVLILADDMGVDYVGAYGEAPNPPCTPNIDSLAGGGMLFRNAWAHPTCVPARAALLTGRHGFRTGLGVPGANGDLALAETIVPEMLTGYASACFGKWHLAGNNNNAHPNQSGFLDYAGPIGGFVDDYQNWPKITNGAPSTSTNYLTRETADDAISWLQSAPEPFFLFLSFNAPHAPWHIPPPASCSGASPAGCAETYCGNLPMPSTVPDRTKAMTEAMDHQIGRVLDTLAVVDPGAYVVFMGDNGSARQSIEPPFPPGHGKATVYEGGVNVPLIIRGPTVANAECSGLVSIVDLFATIGELAGFPAVTEDSVSLVPYFTSPGTSLRNTVYTETFTPNGAGPYTSHDRAVRNGRYKLIRRTGMPDELYDLAVDAHEVSDLMPTLTPAEQSAYDALVAELVALGVD